MTRRRWVLDIILASVFLLIVYTAVTPIGGVSTQAAVKATEAKLNAFGTALQMFHADVGNYPVKLNDLVAKPVGATHWRQYMESIPLDPWQHPYVYECPGIRNTKSFDLFSAGPDGRPGTEDDIVYQQPGK